MVGVDGSLAGQHALDWAAAEAASRALPLQIVHAGHFLDYEWLSGSTADSIARDLDDYAQALLLEAVDRVCDRHPTIEIIPTVSTATPEKFLLAQSSGAAMIVLGAHVDPAAVPTAGFGRSRSITHSVAAYARCPVVVVNTPRPSDPAGRDAVVAGVAASPGGREALRAAFAEAAYRGWELVAVRAWGDLEWDALPGTDSLAAELEATEAALVERCLSEFVAAHPDVVVRRRLVRGSAAAALEDEATGSRVLVLGCRRYSDHWFSRLGPVASWLLHRAPCPVAVVGQAHRPGHDAEERRGPLSGVVGAA
jgi:nucleotide-binding universal stress UspA family protein